MMQKSNSKINIIWDDENKFYGIGFVLNDQKVINELKAVNKNFIKYHEMMTLKNDSGDQISKSYVVKFQNMPRNLLEAIKDTIENLNEQENLTESQALNFVLDLFQKSRLKNDYKEKLCGDIGEVIFMLKAKELGINADSKIHPNDENLYDFIFGNNLFVEIKSTTKNMSEIIIDRRQIEETKNRIFVAVKYQLLPKRNSEENQTNIKNICELYNDLNSTKEEIIRKKINYESDYNSTDIFQELIDECSVDFNKVECFILDESAIPKIKIEHEGGLKNIKCHVGITNCKKYQLDILKKHV